MWVDDLDIMNILVSTNDEEYSPRFVGSDTSTSHEPLNYDALDSGFQHNEHANDTLFHSDSLGSLHPSRKIHKEHRVSNIIEDIQEGRMTR